MVAQATCPDPDVIHDLLCGALPKAEHGELSSHFDLCSDCRQRFEDEASAPEFLGDVSRLCSTPEWQQETATLGRLMQDMPQQLSTAADAASMATWSAEAVSEFFEPSEDPEHIGRLGSYEVIEVIGRGGMGVVLRGIDTKLNRVVAIKVLAPELASNPNARRRFFREGQAAAAVSHDHVVTIHAVDDSERLPYLVMEFVEGESLEECVRRTGSLSIEQILRIGRQTALGLAAAHEVGLVHRDMKPANILLENGIQRVRITDFGLARAVDDVGMTQTGTVSGTPLYMSPEQAGGENVDHRSDLFSLGSVLYTMCTGRPAFRANSTVAVLKRVCEDMPRPIRDVNPDIPDWLAEIIDRLMLKQPNDRLQTASEVAELLGAHLAHLQDPNNVPAPAGVAAGELETVPRSRPRRLLLLAVLTLFVTLGISDATGLTAVSETFMGIILKLTTSEGTLIVEIEDPNVEVAVDGDELIVKGIGKHEIRLKPGKHQATTIREGVAAEQEWVSIESGGREVLRVMQLPPGQAKAEPESTTSVSVSPGPVDIEAYGRPIDGIAFRTDMRVERLGSELITVAPGVGKLIFDNVPEQLWGQRTAMAEVDGGELAFYLPEPGFARPGLKGAPNQRLWLLVPQQGFTEEALREDFAYDTRDSLTKKGWTLWRTVMSHHATTDPDVEENQVKWTAFYQDVKPGEPFKVRTHQNHTSMLVWGSLDMGDVQVAHAWDQRVSVFGPGARIPLGNGHHYFDEVPESLDGLLYNKRNGYQGSTQFRVEKDQRVYAAFYDWQYMMDGNASGGWHEELTPPRKLKQMGWEEVGTMEGRHSNPEYKPATWHIYARDCKRGDTFRLRGHKYQAPIVFAELDRHIRPPVLEGIEIQVPNATDIQRRIKALVEEFNELFKERRYSEATAVARQASEIDPQNPVCTTMRLKAQFALRISRGETPEIDLNGPETSTPGTALDDDRFLQTFGQTISLPSDGVVTHIAPSVGEPAVYGLGSEVTPIRDFPVFFPARAAGRHSDGGRQFIGQIAANVLPGDKVSVEKFERAGSVIRLNLRHEAGPQHEKQTARLSVLEDFNMLEEVRRLTVRYEEARIQNPDHKDAKHWLMMIARHMIARAEIEHDANEARKLREQARERIGTARKLYAAETAGARAEFEAFPNFIDSREDPKLFSRRKQAQAQYINGQLQLAMCMMVEALSERLFSDERADRLTEAADEFETIHLKYRSQLAGLYARLLQGRCLQFLGRPEAALGIYNEVVQHPGTNDSLIRVRNRALHFSLMSLNDDKEDRLGVINKAGDWFANAQAEHRRSIPGAGILWEEALALRGRQPTTPARPLPELMADGNGELILRSTLKILREVQTASENKFSEHAADRIQDVLTLLDTGDTAGPVPSTAFSIYFQAPLIELPTGTYRVEVTLASNVREESKLEDTLLTVGGRFAVPTTNEVSYQLAVLAKRAIITEPVTPQFGTPDTQQPTGLDFTTILAAADQHALVKSFSTNNSQWKQACDMLREQGANWTLCALLDHPNVDVKILAARTLKKMADADTVSVLLAAAKRNRHGINGSESAALHSIYRTELRQALEAATGISPLAPDNMYYITNTNGENVRVSSAKNPEKFPESVDFKRVEHWLRNVYLSDSVEKMRRYRESLGPAGNEESGLSGRATVDGEDAGTVFYYTHGRFFPRSVLPVSFHDSNRFTITLEGFVKVPRDMTVKVWLAGGGVSGDVNWLYIDGAEIGSTGDDRGKNYTYEVPLLEGLHHVRWKLTGGTFRTNILVFLDPAHGKLLPLVNVGTDRIRKSPDEPIIDIDSTEIGWPVRDNWLPSVIDITQPADPVEGEGPPPVRQSSKSAGNDPVGLSVAELHAATVGIPPLTSPGSKPQEPSADNTATVEATDPRELQLQALKAVHAAGGTAKLDPDGNVIELRLDGTKIRDENLALFSAFKLLRSIDMPRTKVTDAGIAHLGKVISLRSIRLYDTKVGDPGIAHLHGLKNLQMIVLKRTHVTHLGADKLQAALPDCLVSYSPRHIRTPNGMSLAPIPAGEFVMGSPATEAGRPEGDEEMQHRVKLTRPFYMGIYEVTQEQWSAVMGNNPSTFSPTGAGRAQLSESDTGKYPVDNVTYDGAVEFCKRLSAMPQERAAGRVYRLPTEAEWEWACRAGTETAFHFGNEADGSRANCLGREPYNTPQGGPFLARTTRVGSYRPNGFGLYDMHGNVWEFCLEPFSAGYYDDSPIEDPPGAEFGLRSYHHTRRGGSWRHAAHEMRSANRNSMDQGQTSSDTGFRVVCYEEPAS